MPLLDMTVHCKLLEFFLRSNTKRYIRVHKKISSSKVKHIFFKWVHLADANIQSDVAGGGIPLQLW